MRRAAALLASLALLLTLLPSAALAAPSETETWIVTLRDDVDPSSTAPGLARAHGGRVGFVYEHAINGFSFRGSQGAASALLRNPTVLSVEADAEVWLDATQKPATWGIDRIDQRTLPLSNSYTYDATGSGVTAYVIDSGINTSHADFGGRAHADPEADFIGDGQDGEDCNGHGTHVAGTIGGGTYGVAKAVRLVSVRVFGCSGGSSWSVIIAGIDWVIADHDAGELAVANMSLGGGASSSVDTATNNLINDGVPTAVAAGNGNWLGREANACNYSPARVPAAMTVSATNSSDAKASWANYGDCVDWFAPGVSIVSASHSSDDGTSTKSGTSMASPHTAGVAALYLQGSATASPETVRDAIYAATTKGIVTSSRTANNHLLYSLVQSGTGSDSSNTGPTANDVAAATGEDVATQISLGGFDAETCELTFSIVSGPSQGSLSSITDTTCTHGTPNTDSARITYTPAPDTNGTDSFSYRVSDGNLTDDATVTITVGAENDAPVAVNDGYSTPKGEVLVVSAPGVLANDTDIDGNVLRVADASAPANGSLTVNSDGSLTYSPRAEFVGTDSFEYTVADPSGATDTATVTITVGSVITVRSLDGLPSGNDGSAWTAGVRVTITDASGAPVEGATVEGTWTYNGSTATATCNATTDSNGQCDIELSGIPKRASSATVTITKVTHTLTWDGVQKSLQVFKP